ncbi:hypothetical protein VOLCADRAFT_91056 [Volvox carteri f. nagariensis]|uniref:Right handed beta helix domain-containing protein n=1 Tax=Volvox carteri f. nagariensis TaxID=3068 RepID=D8TW25_VOLCA|nr:uncharacterized protein VOLCADRAFT_91056 [Volvox carteri f. nagariensis]EFJ48293.1 hypothetical protein VOLCADRAFT_91056 [Volvox carteri f. nagariensis]|eukprot:XP_002950547.1 hypothetical protein VOLCADRAFT_91056 [Volvox carteri f. nagariensis]
MPCGATAVSDLVSVVLHWYRGTVRDCYGYELCNGPTVRCSAWRSSQPSKPCPRPNNDARTMRMYIRHVDLVLTGVCSYFLVALDETLTLEKREPYNLTIMDDKRCDKKLCNDEMMCNSEIYEYAGGNDTISLTFSGGEGLVVDGSLLPTPTAANLNLAAANGRTFPLLRFYKVNGLVLRNLIFRDLDISAPLILIQDCTNVTIQNVTLLRVADVRDASSPSPSPPFAVSPPSKPPTAPPGEPSTSRLQSQLGSNSMARSSAGGNDGGALLPSDLSSIGSHGGAIWLQSVSAARLENLDITFYRHNSSYSSLHGLLIAASRNISASGIHVYGFDAFLAAAVPETADSRAVMIEGTADVSVLSMNCSLSKAACGPCLAAIDSSLIIVSSNFSGNGAEGCTGGAVCLKSEQTGIESKATLLDTVFSNNTAGQGGAACVAAPAASYDAMTHQSLCWREVMDTAPSWRSDIACLTETVQLRKAATSTFPRAAGFLSIHLHSSIAAPLQEMADAFAELQPKLRSLTPALLDAPQGRAARSGSKAKPILEAGDFEVVESFVHGRELSSAWLGERPVRADSTGGGIAAVADHSDGAATHAAIFLDRTSVNKKLLNGLQALRLNLTISNSDFTENVAVEHDATGGAPSGVVASARLRNVDFRGNMVDTGDSGALYASGWDVSLDGGEFTQNMKGWSSDNSLGGAMSVRNCPMAIQISNVKYQENTGIYGGALGADWCSLTLRNVEFTQNSADTDGGGLYVGCISSWGTQGRDKSAYTHILTNVTFKGNSAGIGSGGGLLVDCGNITMTDSSLTENSAFTAGGIKVAPPMVVVGGKASHAVLRGVRFTRNNANSKSGGLHASDVYLTLEKVDFVENYLTIDATHGGAMYVARCLDAVDIRSVSGFGGAE